MRITNRKLRRKIRKALLKESEGAASILPQEGGISVDSDGTHHIVDQNYAAQVLGFIGRGDIGMMGGVFEDLAIAHTAPHFCGSGKKYQNLNTTLKMLNSPAADVQDQDFNTTLSIAGNTITIPGECWSVKSSASYTPGFGTGAAAIVQLAAVCVSKHKEKLENDLPRYKLDGTTPQSYYDTFPINSQSEAIRALASYLEVGDSVKYNIGLFYYKWDRNRSPIKISTEINTKGDKRQTAFRFTPGLIADYPASAVALQVFHQTGGTHITQDIETKREVFPSQSLTPNDRHDITLSALDTAKEESRKNYKVWIVSAGMGNSPGDLNDNDSLKITNRGGVRYFKPADTLSTGTYDVIVQYTSSKKGADAYELPDNNHSTFKIFKPIYKRAPHKSTSTSLKASSSAISDTDPNIKVIKDLMETATTKLKYKVVANHMAKAICQHASRVLIGDTSSPGGVLLNIDINDDDQKNLIINMYKTKSGHVVDPFPDPDSATPASIDASLSPYPLTATTLVNLLIGESGGAKKFIENAVEKYEGKLYTDYPTVKAALKGIIQDSEDGLKRVLTKVFSDMMSNKRVEDPTFFCIQRLTRMSYELGAEAAPPVFNIEHVKPSENKITITLTEKTVQDDPSEDGYGDVRNATFELFMNQTTTHAGELGQTKTGAPNHSKVKYSHSSGKITTQGQDAPLTGTSGFTREKTNAAGDKVDLTERSELKLDSNLATSLSFTSTSAITPGELENMIKNENAAFSDLSGAESMSYDESIEPDFSDDAGTVISILLKDPKRKKESQALGKLAGIPALTFGNNTISLAAGSLLCEKLYKKITESINVQLRPKMADAFSSTVTQIQKGMAKGIQQDIFAKAALNVKEAIAESTSSPTPDIEAIYAQMETMTSPNDLYDKSCVFLFQSFKELNQAIVSQTSEEDKVMLRQQLLTIITTSGCNDDPFFKDVINREFSSDTLHNNGEVKTTSPPINEAIKIDPEFKFIEYQVDKINLDNYYKVMTAAAYCIIASSVLGESEVRSTLDSLGQMISGIADTSQKSLPAEERVLEPMEEAYKRILQKILYTTKKRR